MTNYEKELIKSMICEEDKNAEIVLRFTNPELYSVVKWCVICMGAWVLKTNIKTITDMLEENRK